MKKILLNLAGVLIALGLLFLITGPAHGAYYAGLTASGNGVGTTRENQAALNDDWDAAIQAARLSAPPLELRLAAEDTYVMTRREQQIAHGDVVIVGIALDGSEAPVKIRGDRPVQYVPPPPAHSDQICLGPCNGEPGHSAFNLLAGADGLTFRGFEFRDVGMAFDIKAPIARLTVQSTTANNVRKFLDVGKGAVPLAAPGLTDALFEKVTVFGNSKDAFMFRRTRGLVMNSINVDCDRRDFDFLAAGVSFSGNSPEEASDGAVISDLAVHNCVTTIITAPGPLYGYQQGDAAQQQEYDRNIRYNRLRAFDNGDAGIDNKGSNVTCFNCESAGNFRNYRNHPGGWLNGGLTLINPISRNPKPNKSPFKAAHFQSNGGVMTIINPRIIDTTGQILFKAEEKAFIGVDGGTMTLPKGAKPVWTWEPGAQVQVRGLVEAR